MTIACDWCSDWEHRSCANINHKDLEALGGEKENIALFCSHCLPNLFDALALYQTYYKLDSEFEVKFHGEPNSQRNQSKYCQVH